MRPLDESQLVTALRGGAEDAFAQLVDAHGAAMLRVARLYVRDEAVAQEVVQDAWLAFLRGLDRFQQRSSLRTWLFSILVNLAKTRSVREQRTVPFSSFAPVEGEPSVPAERFGGPGDDWPGHWSRPPQEWDVPLQSLLAREARATIAAAIDQLPGMQRAVVSLRDIEGWSADEVCNVLGLSETNQRVVLHRARTRLREALDRDLVKD
jgi:RNA polymerase sigma-70 factor (ECF subfamily)